MILPWLASKTGVSDHRAEELWRAACRQAEWFTGKRDDSSYWGVVLQNLLDLLEQERLRAYPLLVWPSLLMQGGLQYWSLLTQHWLLAASRSLQSGRQR
ncbi:hypothetical protein ACCUM_3959 [Candidatus Accumulibacter phosphatis]|nr:hypothetical protein ACCUM_3959 [Candidatus Accumulibacter phosphatis]